MSKPLSPLSSSYQNVRARSSVAGSSPFLTKTLDAPSVADPGMQSSPLKQAWSRSNNEARSLSPEEIREDDAENYLPVHNYDGANDYLPEDREYDDDRADDRSHGHGHERDQYLYQDFDENDNDDADADIASSPFRYEAREDTVDFQKMREQTNQQSTFPGMRHHFAIEEEEEPPSSPFRPHVVDVNEEEYIEDEEEKGQPLRDVHTLSPGLDRRLAYDDPASSPFRADVRDEDEEEEFDRAREASTPRSPVMGDLEVQEASSPFRPETEEVVQDDADVQDEQQRLSEEEISKEEIRQEVTVEASGSPIRPEIVAAMASPSATRALKRESFGGRPTQSPKGPRQSPFRHDRENSIAARRAQNLQYETVEKRLSLSKIVPNSTDDDRRVSIAREQVVMNEHLRSVESVPSPRESISEKSQSSAGSRRSSGRHDAEIPKANSPTSNALSRASLGLDKNLLSTTPRKRSFDQTPRDHHDDAEAKERYKKGMVSRDQTPEIHIELQEESSVLHTDNYESTANATYDRSTIGNSVVEEIRNEGMSTVLHNDEDDVHEDEHFERADRHGGHTEEDQDPMDDTGFSNFSVLPDMTSFAKLRAESPLKSMRTSVGHYGGASAGGHRHSLAPATPGTARRPYRNSLMDAVPQVGSPTPRRRESHRVGHVSESSNLLDLTDHMNFYPRQSLQGARYSPNRRSPVRPMRQSMQSDRTPAKMSSLLDFDIPPAPTPRSLPSITPRELESLKSGFLSEISSLKATLSGKEAEVASLKTAVADAERRVGEALEEVRNEAARKDELEMEQAEWDRRGKEMETVLRSVRDELENGEQERERLLHRAEEAEKSKEVLEGRVVELETQLTSARSSAGASASQAGSENGSRRASQSNEATAREVQEAVEKVARELHTLYKSKHETKVAALKKSYETRWEKRLREVEKKLAEAVEESERLRVERDTAQSEAAEASIFKHANEAHQNEKRVFEAQIRGLQEELAALKEEMGHLRVELDAERTEKGELVAAVDEWLSIQHTTTAQRGPSQEHERQRQASVSSMGDYDVQSRASAEPVENHYPRGGRMGSGSNSRSGSGSGFGSGMGLAPGPAPSGTRAPGAGEKRIPRFGAPAGHSRGQSGNKSGIAMPTPGRGGIMSSIERMGRGTGGA
ncbi:hypothetical protein N7539_003102 [Penicillium diatomitis]|uniref:Uncharacterized protein n=1 Tax=Penicillium diatomitis TaxID=2819901 RepID=A0A9W9XFX7_9EURO|nr:uncharacterized protein N7539_003102 [Penicillium diatomitis]KAJ5491535.1 hypothetical protein N7539_003102 [Penicillium diatomitis]